jgi:Flp pilus assembly protein TadD
VEETYSIALVLGMLPATMEEIDQLDLVTDGNVYIVTSDPIALVIKESCFFDPNKIIPLPHYEDESTYLPNLEETLKNFSLVIINDRTNLYAYQTLKAKWQFKNRILVWVDNLVPFVCQDSKKLRTIRSEITSGADAFFVQTKEAYEALLLEKISSEKIYFIPPTIKKIDILDKKHAKSKLGFLESDFLIGFYGPIEWEESLFDLIHSLYYLFQSKPSYKKTIKILLMGKGSLSGEIRDRVIELKLESNISYLSVSKSTRSLFFSSIDRIFISSKSQKDRYNGNPFRYIASMAYSIPSLSPRSAISQLTIEKHRFDFCSDSLASLSIAIEKSLVQESLALDFKKKNTLKVEERFSNKKFSSEFHRMIHSLVRDSQKDDYLEISDLINEVEKKIHSKQYLSATKLIEHIFSDYVLSEHERSNLLRLIGDCFLKLGDKDASKNAYIQAIELDPYSAKSYIGLGTLSLMKQNFEIGLIHFQKAISLCPSDEMSYLGLGLSFQGIDEHKEAEKWISKSLEINPENTSAIYSLVKVNYDLDCYTSALTCLNRYLERHPDDHSLRYTIAGIYFKIKDYENAISHLLLITDYNPMDSRALSLLRQARKKLEFAGESLHA